MLTVYKASAGSGKTFRLATEYIKHLIIDPNRYEHILAVTFTNKATEEMKMRILSQLYGLSHQLPGSKGYMNVILNDLRLMRNIPSLNGVSIDEALVANRSKMALHHLLHNYHYFRVQTIDKFFQTVLRNLAHELDLTPNLRVELGDKDVEHQAVDSWIDRLKENDKELNWILDYIRSSMDENKAWNVIGQIKEFGESLLKDDYKQYSQQLTECLTRDNDKFYDEYVKRLHAIVNNANKQINEAGAAIWQQITANGMDETSFKGGTRSGVGIFIKRMTEQKITELKISASAQKCIDTTDVNADNWVTKGASSAVRNFCLSVLRPLLISAMELLRNHTVTVRSATITLSNMSKLRLLRAIQQEINDSNRLHDRFLLSDTQTLLSNIIDGTDTPFVFEKIGTHIHNIMIDEFQDTSRIQWQNFKVMLNECMSHGTDNLIVGDVKQSIYRWRSGDWRLLHNISSEFTQDVMVKPLNINRRSSTTVINFNNAFFRTAIDTICDQLKDSKCRPEDIEMFSDAYSDLHQFYPDEKEEGGYVEVKLLEKDDYDTQTLNYITDTIMRLTSNGIQQRDIAILVRTNKHIPVIASHCMSVFRNSTSPNVRNLSIVSDEAFLLSSSPAVCMIVDAIRLLVSPDDAIVKARLSMTYQQHVLNIQSHPTEILSSKLLPEEYLSHTEQLLSMPLYQLCETLYSQFQLSLLTSQSAFVCYFFDCLSEFLSNTIGDIQSFLDYWDETMCSKKIESDSDDGIRILSIHKSKGLEYEHVIIPYCDWKLELASLLWCQPDTEPFNALPVIPLMNNKTSMLDTIYEPYYWEEHIQNIVDNINLLYVAFTRAKNGLYISTQAGQNDTYRGALIEKVVSKISIDNAHTEPMATHHDDDDDPEEHNVFLMPSQQLTVNVRNSKAIPVFRESNKSREFTLTDDNTDEIQRLQYIKMGNILHSLFSSIRTIDDVPAAIAQFEMEGLLSDADISADSLRKHINRSMADPQKREWFSPRWTLYNECDILSYDSNTGEYSQHRPDRVMTDGKHTIVVDFKLYSVRQGYHDQVRRYMECLRRMGHQNVRGYLWFVMSGQVIEVE